MATIKADPTRVAHPLEPLTADEIARAVSILRSEKRLGDSARFATVTLAEPPKDVVLGFRTGESWDRSAFAVVMDNEERKTFEAFVSLSQGTVTSWEHIPGVQPAILLDEFFECEAACKADPRWQEAMRKRGITDFDLAMVDPWSAGYYGPRDGEEGRRLSRALTWLRTSPNDNGYARPIEGLITMVDLNEMKVLYVEDHGITPLPTLDANYSPEVAGRRTDLKQIEITQPEGPSFEVEGHHVSWQKWKLRLGFTPREGLVIHTVSYEDRPILYRAALSDMVVPYGDPRTPYYRRNAFDVGEYGIGMLANALELGCDCLGEIRYFDGLMTDSRGNVITLHNAICMHEEDYGILWKHYDWRTNYTEVRRSRRLVVSFISTVGNYEYGFFWYFYQDGNIEFEVKLSGIISNGALAKDEPTPKWGARVTPEIYAPIHQHFFNVRMDMMVDGPNNTVLELNTQADPIGPENPHGNAFYEVAKPISRESGAARRISPFTARTWKIINPNKKNSVGLPTGYRLMPGDNTLPFAHPEAAVIQRAAFMTNHLWVTKYEPREMFAAGDYPNQHKGGAGLPEFQKRDANLENTDVVVWYTFGAHHPVRPEDWPVMPAAYIGFMLKPSGFFERNPGLDVPPTKGHGMSTNGTGDGACCH